MANEKRLIDANALKVKGFADPETGEGIVYVQDIDEAPTVDAVEVVRGWWDKYEDDKFIGYGADGRIQYRKVYTYYCGRCGRGTAVKTNFCPNCGADMRERKDNERKAD